LTWWTARFWLWELASSSFYFL